jgi:hypothetical protein
MLNINRRHTCRCRCRCYGGCCCGCCGGCGCLLFGHLLLNLLAQSQSFSFHSSMSRLFGGFGIGGFGGRFIGQSLCFSFSSGFRSSFICQSFRLSFSSRLGSSFIRQTLRLSFSGRFGSSFIRQSFRLRFIRQSFRFSFIRQSFRFGFIRQSLCFGLIRQSLCLRFCSQSLRLCLCGSLVSQSLCFGLCCTLGGQLLLNLATQSQALLVHQSLTFEFGRTRFLFGDQTSRLIRLTLCFRFSCSTSGSFLFSSALRFGLCDGASGSFLISTTFGLCGQSGGVLISSALSLCSQSSSFFIRASFRLCSESGGLFISTTFRRSLLIRASFGLCSGGLFISSSLCFCCSLFISSSLCFCCSLLLCSSLCFSRLFISSTFRLCFSLARFPLRLGLIRQTLLFCRTLCGSFGGSLVGELLLDLSAQSEALLLDQASLLGSLCGSRCGFVALALLFRFSLLARSLLCRCSRRSGSCSLLIRNALRLFFARHTLAFRFLALATGARFSFGRTLVGKTFVELLSQALTFVQNLLLFLVGLSNRRLLLLLLLHNGRCCSNRCCICIIMFRFVGSV